MNHHASDCPKESYKATTCRCGFTAEHLARGGVCGGNVHGHATYDALPALTATPRVLVDLTALVADCVARAAALPPWAYLEA